MKQRVAIPQLCTERDQKQGVLWIVQGVGEIVRMAERVRFELTVLAYTRVPGVHLKPLGHLSVGLGCNECSYLNVQLQFINQKTLCQVKKLTRC